MNLDTSIKLTVLPKSIKIIEKVFGVPTYTVSSLQIDYSINKIFYYSNLDKTHQNFSDYGLLQHDIEQLLGKITELQQDGKIEFLYY